jgi:hypothetical protein
LRIIRKLAVVDVRFEMPQSGRVEGKLVDQRMGGQEDDRTTGGMKPAWKRFARMSHNR